MKTKWMSANHLYKKKTKHQILYPFSGKCPTINLSAEYMYYFITCMLLRADEWMKDLLTQLYVNQSGLSGQKEAEFYRIFHGLLPAGVTQEPFLTCNNLWNLLLLKLVWTILAIRKVNTLFADCTRVILNTSSDEKEVIASSLWP